MTREVLAQWLDKQVEIYHLIKDNHILHDGDEEFCYEYANGQNNNLGLGNLLSVAEMMDIPVKCEPFDLVDSEWKFKLTITYRGVTFYTLSEEEVVSDEQTSTGIEV